MTIVPQEHSPDETLEQVKVRYENLSLVNDRDLESAHTKLAELENALGHQEAINKNNEGLSKALNTTREQAHGWVASLDFKNEAVYEFPSWIDDAQKERYAEEIDILYKDLIIKQLGLTGKYFKDEHYNITGATRAMLIHTMNAKSRGSPLNNNEKGNLWKLTRDIFTDSDQFQEAVNAANGIQALGPTSYKKFYTELFRDVHSTEELDT